VAAPVSRLRVKIQEPCDHTGKCPLLLNSLAKITINSSGVDSARSSSLPPPGRLCRTLALASTLSGLSCSQVSFTLALKAESSAILDTGKSCPKEGCAITKRKKKREKVKKGVWILLIALYYYRRFLCII
jgi:hypothetical protein